MNYFLEYSTPTGTVLVEVDFQAASSDRVEKAGSGAGRATALITKAQYQFDSALSVVREAATALVSQIDLMSDRPSQVEVTFGLKATGEGGIFAIAKVGGEVNFSVTLSWSRAEARTESLRAVETNEHARSDPSGSRSPVSS
jgi:hypothetical protein